jgi:hypothetical protein
VTDFKIVGDYTPGEYVFIPLNTGGDAAKAQRFVSIFRELCEDRDWFGRPRLVHLEEGESA